MLSFDLCSDFYENAPVIDNKYKVLYKIGEGRYAKVKLAMDIESKKKYAIKIMRESQFNSPNKIENFLNEVQILSSVQHQHIVQIIHCNLNGESRKNNGEVCKVAYYVMKFAEHGEFFKLLQNTPRFSEKLARYFFHQLIQSVKYLHEKGIGHRDIKTENILLDKKNRLILADFGCACRTRNEMQQRVSFSNKIQVGSPEFNAPEIANTTSNTNYFAEDADIFASATVLFLMVFQSPPFNSTHAADPYYSRLCKKDTSSFWKIFDVKDISDDLKDLIERMMCQQPEKRIKIEEIEKHPWYTGPLLSKNEVKNEMKERIDIIVNFNKLEIQSMYEVKRTKSKNPMMQEPKNNLQRVNTKVESLRQKHQETINQINKSLEKERIKKQKSNAEKKNKKINEDIGGGTVGSSGSTLFVKNYKQEECSSKPSQNIDIISQEAMNINSGSMNKKIGEIPDDIGSSVRGLYRNDESDRDVAKFKRKKGNTNNNNNNNGNNNNYSRREEDKFNRSGSDSEE